MHFLTRTESDDVAKDLGRLWIGANPLVSLGSYRIPVDAGAKRALARGFTELARSERGCFIRVAQWGVWPSSENMFLFALVRQALGETRRVMDVPGHPFDSSETRLADAILHLCLVNFWDAIFADLGGRFRLMLSHDEMMDIDCAPALIENVKAYIAQMKLS